MRLVTQCGRNYQQGERNQTVTYKPTILKLLTPCILINFFPSTKPTKCTYNMHNSTVHSKCVPWMNTLCSASIRGAHSEQQNNGLSGSVQHTDVSIRNIIFSYFLNQLKQNVNNMSNIDDLNSNNSHCILITLYNTWGTSSLAIGCGTALQVGTSRVRFPMVALDFSQT